MQVRSKEVYKRETERSLEKCLEIEVGGRKSGGHRADRAGHVRRK